MHCVVLVSFDVSCSFCLAYLAMFVFSLWISVVHDSFCEISALHDEQIAYVEHMVVQMTLTFQGINANDFTSNEHFNMNDTQQGRQSD